MAKRDHMRETTRAGSAVRSRALLGFDRPRLRRSGRPGISCLDGHDGADGADHDLDGGCDADRFWCGLGWGDRQRWGHRLRRVRERCARPDDDGRQRVVLGVELRDDVHPGRRCLRRGWKQVAAEDGERFDGGLCGRRRYDGADGADHDLDGGCDADRFWCGLGWGERQRWGHRLRRLRQRRAQPDDDGGQRVVLGVELRDDVHPGRRCL